MLSLNVFKEMNRDQEHAALLAAFDSMHDDYDRYRALIAVEALAGEGDQP